jgi:hypothetical protein
VIGQDGTILIRFCLQFDTARDIKEKAGFVTNSWKQPSNSSTKSQENNAFDYELPDGTMIR